MTMYSRVAAVQQHDHV